MKQKDKNLEQIKYKWEHINIKNLIECTKKRVDEYDYNIKVINILNKLDDKEYSYDEIERFIEKYLDENFCNLPISRWNLHGINIWDSFEKSFDIYHQLYIY